MDVHELTNCFLTELTTHSPYAWGVWSHLANSYSYLKAPLIMPPA